MQRSVDFSFAVTSYRLGELIQWVGHHLPDGLAAIFGRLNALRPRVAATPALARHQQLRSVAELTKHCN